MDAVWWDAHIAEVRGVFHGELATQLPGARRLGITPIPRFNPHGNSGAGAIALAAHLGASRAVLLGYDCQRTGGKSHWHGDHPKGLTNAGSLPKWQAQFGKLAASLRGMNVVNCTRQTALVVFPREPLESALC